MKNTEHLYLKFEPEEEIPKTLKALLMRLLFESPDSTGHYPLSSATYFSSKCGRLHCPPGRIRSFDDVLRVSRTYFPNVTIKQIVLVLFTINHDGKFFLRPGYCGNIRKITLNITYQRFTVTEYTALSGGVFFKSKGISQYSWGELFKLIGIKTPKDFKKIIKN